jgi:hypothetical protein
MSVCVCESGLEPWTRVGSVGMNRRDPKSCLGRVFKSKLGCSAALDSKCLEGMQTMERKQPLTER